jgi:hypothetical protein
METDYTAIAGGVGDLWVETVAHGGENVVVGGLAKVSARDRVLSLKYVPDDPRQLLALIGMGRPIGWGHVEYDDGAKEKKLARASTDAEPDAAVMTELESRLTMKPAKVTELLAKEYALAEPVAIALVDMIALLAGHMKKHKPDSRPLAINPAAGEVLARLTEGETYFKIVTDRDDVPATLTAIVRELLNKMVTVKCSRPTTAPMETAPAIKRPTWPAIDPEVAAKMDAWPGQPKAARPSDAGPSATTPPSLRSYVEAIIMREHELVAHMDAVERYYVDTARDLITYTAALQAHFELCT